MPNLGYKQSESHKKAISKSLLGHKTTAETKKRISSAKRRVWIKFNCCYCKKECEEKESHYKRKNRHFCSMKCYVDFQREFLPKEEHNAYGHGHSPEERIKRRKARSVLNHYLRDKKLPRPPCEKCNKKAEAHHDDYNKPLDVRWLCFKHHREHHKIYEHPNLLNP